MFKLNLSLVLVLIIIIMFVNYSQVKAQVNGEIYDTPFGKVLVYEIKRDSEPNLICYGYDDGKLIGCVVRN